MSVMALITEAMGSLKFIVVSLLIGLVVGAGVAWKVQGWRFDAKLLDITNKSLQAIQKSQQEAQSKERENENAISSLNKQNAEYNKKLDSARADLRKYRSLSGGLLVKPSSGTESVSTSTSTTNSTTNGKTGIEIPREFSEFLADALMRADKCEADLNTAKDYAKMIETFRKEQSK